jgi:REP element-mobilizing transposase RayT
MARPWRIEYEGALYHVFSRGNNRQDIFVTDDDRRMFLDTIGQMSERFESRIFAYVLMDNHYHLLLRTARANLSRNMQWLGTTYTRRYNLKHFQSGHLFQGRFNSTLVENDVYLMQLSYYIHHNPLRAGIVRRLIDYHWSSYPAYAYNRRHPDWLDKELILSQIQGQNKHLLYRKKSQEYSAENLSILEDIRHGFIYGSQKFVKKIKARYMTGKPDPAVPQQKSILKDDDPLAFVSKAAGILQCDLETTKSAPRVSQSDKIKRDILLYLLWQQGSFTNKQIGAVMGLTHSAVSRRVRITKNKMELERDFARYVKRIKSLIKP